MSTFGFAMKAARLAQSIATLGLDYLNPAPVTRFTPSHFAKAWNAVQANQLEQLREFRRRFCCAIAARHTNSPDHLTATFKFGVKFAPFSQTQIKRHRAFRRGCSSILGKRRLTTIDQYGCGLKAPRIEIQQRFTIRLQMNSLDDPLGACQVGSARANHQKKA